MRHEVNSLLKELADISGETANFAVLNGRHAVILQSVESRGDLRVVPPVGTIDTLTRKSIGKAILASLPENQAMNIVEQEGLSTFTQKSITSLKDFQAELARVRKQGYATDFEEFQEGINAVSAPVFNKGGHVFGSISVVGPTFRMPGEKMHLYGKECARKAERISSILRLFPNNENETDFISKMKYTLGIG